MVAKGQAILVEAKRSDDENSRLANFLPEAVGQALALAKLTRSVPPPPSRNCAIS